MSNRFSRATQWIVDRPTLVIALILLLSGIALTGYRAPGILDSLVSDKSEAEVVDTDVLDADSASQVGSADSFSLGSFHAILVAQSDSFFTEQGANAMRAVVDGLSDLDHVDQILWMDMIPGLNIFGLPEPILPRAKASPERFAASLDKARNHPFIRGQFVSDDGKTMLLMINFDFLFIEEDDQCAKGLREAAEKIAAEYDGFDVKFMITGRLPVFLTAIETHESNQLKYQLIGYAMIVFMSLVLFRGFSAVLILIMAPALGVFWTMGIIRFFDFQNNPFNDVVLPVLISLVGFTDGVHLMVQIRKFRASGMPSRQATREGIRRVGMACLLTSVTTAIGFGSLSLAHHTMVREFGYSCVIGVLMTFIAVITSIPLGTSSWLGRNVHVGLEKSLVDRNLGRISGIIEFVMHHKKIFAFIGIAITMALFAASMTLRPDERQANALPESSEAAIAIREMDKAMGGLEFSGININWSENVQDNSEVLTVVRKLDRLLDEEPLIGYPVSIADMLDALPGDGLDADRVSMLDLLPPPLVQAFFQPENRFANTVFRVKDLGIAKYGPVFTRIQDGIAEIRVEHPDFEIDMTGTAVWRWENLYQIVVDLATSLGTAAIIIFIVLSFVYRSLRIGLISIIPNIFPLAVSGTYLAVSGQSLEIVSVCAFTVCLGIAVDDTIHFLTCYREELETNPDQATAIRNAFTGVGTALILTTIVLVCGFMTVIFSDLRDHRVFATMGAITVSSALFGDLVFLPAILACFGKGKSEQDETQLE